MKESKESMNRRQFIERSALGAGALAAVGAGMASGAETKKAVNPFAYDVERFSKTDPKLLHYEQAGRFVCPNPEPRRMVIGPQNHLYLATRNGVTILDGDGGRAGEIPLSAPVKCVAVAGDGTVYAGLQDHVEVFDGKGQRLAAWDTPGKKTWLSGLAVGEQGVFAADSGNRVIWRFDKSGRVAGRVGEKNKDRNVPGLIVPSPYLDVKLAPDGLLRVNNPGRHCVETYTQNGDLELSWGKPSAAIGSFCGCCNPIGLALLPDGRCVTCEKGLPRVKIYSADGTFESVVAGPESFPENAHAHSLSDCSVGGLDAAVDSQGRIFVLDLVVADVRVMRRKAQ